MEVVGTEEADMFALFVNKQNLHKPLTQQIKCDILDV